MVFLDILQSDLPKGFFKGINTIFGVSASGKTTLCMQYATIVLKQAKKVIFIDTEEGFSLDRAKQLGLTDLDLKNMILISPTSFFEQESCLLKFDAKIPNLGLLVLDTVGMFYRIQAKKNFKLANDSLKRQIDILKSIAEKNNIPILLSNQVYTNVETGETKMLGNAVIERNSLSLIELNKTGPKRSLYLKKPFDKELIFEIIDKGLTPAKLK